MASIVESDVLTLEEAADYLRVTAAEMEHLAQRGIVPARQIQDQWRFLRTALEEWLSHRDSRHVLLSQAGALADDPSLQELLTEIYKRRGRPEVEPSDA